MERVLLRIQWILRGGRAPGVEVDRNHVVPPVTESFEPGIEKSLSEDVQLGSCQGRNHREQVVGWVCCDLLDYSIPKLFRSLLSSLLDRVLLRQGSSDNMILCSDKIRYRSCPWEFNTASLIKTRKKIGIRFRIFDN